MFAGLREQIGPGHGRSVPVVPTHLDASAVHGEDLSPSPRLADSLGEFADSHSLS